MPRKIWEKNMQKGHLKTTPTGRGERTRSRKHLIRKIAHPSFLCYSLYTKLNEDCDSIFLAIKGRVSFRKSPPIQKDHEKRDPNKYCHYHKNIRHKTNDYTVLKDKIEELIWLGHLKEQTHENFDLGHNQCDSGYNNHDYQECDYRDHGRCDQRSWRLD